MGVLFNIVLSLTALAAPPTILPWGGATPAPTPTPTPYKGPMRATLACAEGVRNFPFLKTWVAKLDNFVAPTEIGSTEGSLFYAIGATTVGKNAVEAWKTDAFTAPVDSKGKGGSIESAWLGEWTAGTLKVEPGPGFSRIKVGNKGSDTSQMGGRTNTGLRPADPAIQGYAANAIGETGKAGAFARLWSQLHSPAELALLEACGLSRCMIKFNDEELKTINGASHQYRLTHFRALLEKRIDEYRKVGHIWAYEGTHAPMDWQDLPISPAFPAKFDTHFWEPANRTAYGYEVLDAEPGHHKPVTGIFSRQCEKRGQGAQAFTACTDIVVYNNHYFDFWARLVFFFPWCDVQVALVYETLDIDQIKESRVVRVLFGGEMRNLMAQLLETRLKRMHMLGF